MKTGLLEGRRVLVVIAPVDFCEEELLEAMAVFEGYGAVVEVTSTRAARARGDFGAQVEPDLVIGQADPHRYCAVVVLGGGGAPAYLWENGALHALLRLAHDDSAVIGALSHSSPALARAGLLWGVRATVFGLPRGKFELARGGAFYLDEAVVADQGIVTGAGSHDARAFAEAVVRAVVERQSEGARA